MEANIIFSVDAACDYDVLKYVRTVAKLRKKSVKGKTRIGELSKSIFAVKIGLLNIVDNGLGLIKEIRNITDLDIVCDLKIADIPYIAGEIARKVQQAGADYIVVQSFVGEKTLSQIKEAAPNLRIILVTEMTHNEGGFTQFHLNDFLSMAVKHEVFGVIGPGNRPKTIELIKRAVGHRVKVIAAGVSIQQGGEDQLAINAGADYLVKGRSIMDAIDAQVSSSLFDFDRRKMARRILFPFGVYLTAAVALIIALSRFSLRATTITIAVTLVFLILRLVLENIIKP
jgi:orotidine-5'-phosphate decarboxylase